jgi:hypothetical protein
LSVCSDSRFEQSSLDSVRRNRYFVFLLFSSFRWKRLLKQIALLQTDISCLTNAALIHAAFSCRRSPEAHALRYKGTFNASLRS